MRDENDLVAARLFAGLTVADACALTGRHRTTWRRMERGETRVDLACLRLLELISGDLGVIHAAWTGCLIDREGDLYVPGYARGFTFTDIMRIPWLMQIAATHQAPLKSAPANISQVR